MRVHIFKGLDDKLTVMVEASPGKGRPPVVFGPIAREDIKKAALPVIEAMRRPKGEPMDLVM